MSIDMNRVGLLLHVITEAVGHGSAYRDIVAEANLELQGYNEIARQDGLKRAADKAKADAVAAAELQARQNELAAEAEARLKAEAQQKLDDEIHTKAQVEAAAKAKVEPVASPDPEPATTFTSDNGRRL